ncbi:MAG TPA: CvpA family protein [Verrucomicrobiae bacterium]|jgi:uncharacterized membrane protein required for colicin V production|nr:CvpA family protein [Verrucomicrobiae bacterium]
MAWPDIVIAAIVVLATFKGFQKGFVKELAGAVALFLSLTTPWFYNGSLDKPIDGIAHVGPGSAHVIGMFLTGIATYAILIALSLVLDKIARLPILGIGNAILGAAVGFLKAAIFCWLILYVALFFPLSPDIRAGLHQSKAVAYLTQWDDAIDSNVKKSIPWFARPFINPFFWRHHP